MDFSKYVVADRLTFLLLLLQFWASNCERHLKYKVQSDVNIGKAGLLKKQLIFLSKTK